MKAHLALALMIGLAACGGETTVPLDASFPLGPKQVRLALDAAFPDVLTPDATTWPDDQPETTIDLDIVKTASISLGSKPEYEGKALKLDPAWVSVDADAPGVDALELYVAPSGATAVTDANVQSLAHAPVPTTSEEDTLLTWSDDGPELLAAALSGKLQGEKGARAFTLLVRARTTVTLEPGETLPGSDVEAHVKIAIPLRYSP